MDFNHGIHNFIMGMFFGTYGDDFGGYNRWAGASEKSKAALRREAKARDKFDYVRDQMELANYENVMTMIGLACHPTRTTSPLRILPNAILSTVMQYAGYRNPSTPGLFSTDSMNHTNDDRFRAQHRRIRHAARGRIAVLAAIGRDEEGGPESMRIIPCAGWGQQTIGTGRDANHEEYEKHHLDLADMSLYNTPGKKIIIPLTVPNEHLTAPCYRDLRKHVKEHTNWDVKRVVATPAQKQEYRETRKGSVYFISVVYTVPGMITKTTRKRKKSADTTSPIDVGERKSPPELLLSQGDEKRTKTEEPVLTPTI
jgi:hypothetical protein